jgi:hypothetical protein
MSYLTDILISHQESDARLGTPTAEVNFAAGPFVRGPRLRRGALAHALARHGVELKEFVTTN